MNLPLTHLSPIQSLGYMEPGQSIRCSSALAGFSVGTAYPFRQIPVTVERTVERPSVSEPDQACRLTARDTCFAATDDSGHEHLFIDRNHLGEGITVTCAAPAADPVEAPSRAVLSATLRNALAKLDRAPRPLHPQFPLEQLVEHFEIIPPPDIAEANPALYQWGLKFLESIEQIVSNPRSAIRNPAGLEADLGRKPQSPNFHWKPFQADDMARVSIPDGAIYSGEPGVGKTPMGIGWALLKVGLNPQSAIRNPQLLTPAAPVLIVAPGGLLHQMQADYAALFGRAWPGVTRIDSQTTLTSLLARNRGRLAPGWYMSSFEEIGLNKFQVLPQIPDGPVPDAIVRGLLEYFELKGNGLTLEQGLEMCRKIVRETSAGLGTERLYTVNEDRGSRIEDGGETPSSKRNPPSSSFSIHLHMSMLTKTH